MVHSRMMGSRPNDLFFRWKGSILKLVSFELCIFLSLFGSLSFLYRFVLYPDQRVIFENLCLYCEKYGTFIPVSFVLGFYVSLVINRWWAQYKLLPWPDAIAMWVNDFVRGDSDDDRMLRRTICRYVCLSITLCYTKVSIRTKRRFPTINHFVAAGLLMEHEKAYLEETNRSVANQENYIIPLVWANSLITRARLEGKMFSDTCIKMLLDEINKIRINLNLLLCFDRVNVPVVYTQVATFATYSYFFSCIFSRQFLSQERNSNGSDHIELDLVFPFFTTLQFLFYIGWLKVAESLAHPFGDEEYDFELNWMIDRNLKVCYTIVDKIHFLKDLPTMKRDIHWDEVIPCELPQTKASLKCRRTAPETSASILRVSTEDSKIVHVPEYKVSENKPRKYQMEQLHDML